LMDQQGRRILRLPCLFLFNSADLRDAIRLSWY
jgi:hypothetical protein